MWPDQPRPGLSQSHAPLDCRSRPNRTSRRTASGQKNTPAINRPKPCWTPSPPESPPEFTRSIEPKGYNFGGTRDEVYEADSEFLLLQCCRQHLRGWLGPNRDSPE